MGRYTDQFKCASCNNLRDRRTEMSKFSKDLCRSKAAAKMHSKEISALLYCRFCHLDLNNLSPAAAKAMEKRAYWESRVTPHEAGEDRKPGPVTTKQVEEVESTARRKGYSPTGRGKVAKKKRDDVAKKVRMARYYKRKTQAQVGKEVGCSGSTVGYVERAADHVTKAGLELVETWADLVLLEMEETTKPKEEAVVIRHPKGSTASGPAPWEVDEMNELKERLMTIETRMARLDGAILRWMQKYEQQAPSWQGWSELRDALGEVG